VTEGAPVLIYGAGRRGEWISQELIENRGLGLHPIGFLDDDPYLSGSSINRVRILGSSRDLASILDSRKVSALIISSHKIAAECLVPLMGLCSKQRIPVLRGEFHLDRLSVVRLSGTREASAHRKHVAAVPGDIHVPGHSSTVESTVR